MKKLFIFSLVFFLNCATNTDKTLVSWVKLNDPSVTGGSVLTIQSGDQFDGIVFGEMEPGKWIAGSDEWNRTRRELKNIEPEKEGAMTNFIQMAIVYQGDQIRIYRDGELYTGYKAQNIDLLSSDENCVVFGLRHLGGEGYVSAEIEDARIYAKVLSPEELNSLEPDVASAMEPYAWWDFEGDEYIEKTGRYSYHNPGEAEDVALKNGRLELQKWGSLIALREYSPEKPEWPEDPPKNWLTFHLAHPGPGTGEPGDPNPAYYYKGQYHLHYIYRSIYGFNYAHVSSDDLVYWKWHRTVLTPPFTNHGMFSGTGFFTKEGQPAMIYHGVGSGRNQLCYALDDSLDVWTKPEAIIPKNEQGSPVDMNHWDPDLWINKDTYYALSGGEDPDLIRSADLKNWTYLGKLLHEDYPDDLGVDRDEDISCANMFRIGDKWMLLCISHRLGCRYFLGDFKDEKYLPGFHAKMNWVNTDWDEGHKGLVYFAPESMLLPDGRRIMWAWVMGDIAPSAVQALPRELELPKDGVLRIRPLRELSKLRFEEKVRNKITVKKGADYKLEDIQGDALELKLTFKAPLPDKFGVDLFGNGNGDKGIRITAGANKKTLGIGPIEPPFELREREGLTLRIFIDKNMVEVFANDRQAAAVAQDEITSDLDIRLFSEDREVVVEEAIAWKMKPIFGKQMSQSLTE